MTNKKLTKLLLCSFLLLTNINPIVVHAEPEPTEPTVPEEPTDPTPDPEPTPEPEPTPTPEPEEPDEPVYIASSNSRLYSLSVDDKVLSPRFDPDVTEYSLILPADTTKVNIIAETEDGYASVEGTGEFKVSYTKGAYDFKVTCYAENGSSTDYVIHVTISSEPVLFTAVDGLTLGFVIKDLDKLNPPEGFIREESSYQGQKITVFNNKGFPFTLVYLQNDANKKADWYCYQGGVVTGVFKNLVINKNKYYYAGISDDIKSQSGYSYTELNVVGEKLNGWKVDGENNKDKVMLYLYDNAGNADYYIYNTEDQTMMNRREFEVGLSKSKKHFLLSPLSITIAIVLVIACAYAFIIVSGNKKRSIKDVISTIKHHLKHGNKKVKTSVKDIDDGTVELVRTSKVRIFAHPEEVNTNDETKEFVVTEKQKEEKPIAEAVIKEPEPEIKLPIVEKVKEELEVKLPVIEETKKEPVIEQPKVEPIDFSKILASLEEKEPEVAVLTESKDDILNAIKEKQIHVSVAEPIEKKPAKKLRLFSKKKEEVDPKKEVQEENKPNASLTKKKKNVKVKEEVKPVVIEKEEPIKVEPIQEEKTEVQNSYTSMEEDPMFEIQKYIDQLFYLPENKDK